jgi:hypothetical protein
MSHKCSVCHQWSDFRWIEDGKVIDDPVSSSMMPHIFIPTKFFKCGHIGVFRWTKKEWEEYKILRRKKKK